MAESFWSTPKTEFCDRRSWPTRGGAKLAVAPWAEALYNRRRRYSALDYASPIDYERHLPSSGHDRHQLTLAASPTVHDLRGTPSRTFSFSVASTVAWAWTPEESNAGEKTPASAL